MDKTATGAAQGQTVESGAKAPVGAPPNSEISERGFVHWTPVETTYGHEVKVYESSAATDPPCMWLAVGKPSEEGEAAHLTYEQVMQVQGRIRAWLQRHREAGARWAADRYAADLARELGIAWEPDDDS